MYSQVQYPVRLSLYENIMIQQVLPECLFEVIHIGAPHKAFDFDSDFLPVFFRSQQLFGTQIDVDIGGAPS